MSETFGVWELLTRLGQNELGEAHLAIRTSDQRKAVLKQFSVAVHSDMSFYGPLKSELELASHLAHPSASQVLEQGEVDGVAFVAFEYVNGTSLSKLTRAAQASGAWPLSMNRAVSLMRPVLDALSAAHGSTPALLHRELVAQNVLATREGRVVLTDFGLGRARLRAGGDTTGMRRAFVSPEQARGNATDARSEVFAVGLMLFELVCGRLPAEGAAGEVIARIATGELDGPLSVNPALDDEAVAVLKRALAVRPEERFATAAEFFVALEPWSTTLEAGQAALGEWVTRLDAVKAVAAPVVVSKSAEPTPLLTTEKVPAVDRPAANFRRNAIAGLVIAGLFVLYQVIDLKAVFQSSSEPPVEGRSLELTSIPSGAQVFVDGVAEVRRTPMTLSIPKDEFRNLTLKKAGFTTWLGHIANVRKLEVTLATGAIDEERYEGARPPAKATTEPKAVPLEATQAPKQEVVFDAEAPPIDVVLTQAHSVQGDRVAPIEIPAGSVVSALEGFTQYLVPSSTAVGRNAMQKMPTKNTVGMLGWRSASTGSSRTLNLFAYRNNNGAIEVFDLSKPTPLVTGGLYSFFSPTESGESNVSGWNARLNDGPLALTGANLLRVDQDDSFLIRVLQPRWTYRVELSRADGKPGPLPVVLMSMRPDLDVRNQDYPRFDGEATASGQLIVSGGVHTFSGASNVWFTLVGGKGAVLPDVKLSVRLAKKQR